MIKYAENILKKYDSFMKLTVIILAAGQGKRMHSKKPKLLHELAGKPLLTHVYETVNALKPTNIIIVCGHLKDELKKQLTFPVTWVEQEEQLGTGHAALQALPFIEPDSQVLVLVGDVPCLSRQTLEKLIKISTDDSITFLTTCVSKPFGLGRIIRDEKNNFVEVIEEKDATAEQRHINEINAGIFIAPQTIFAKYLPLLKPHNAQQELYLTDVPKMAKADGFRVNTLVTHDEMEIQGINDRCQLAALERYYQHKQAQTLMTAGVTLRDPTRFDLRGEITFGQDVEIDVNVLLEGKISLGNNCRIGANTVIRNSRIGDNVQIKENCVIEDSVIENDCTIGPFSRLRPEALLKNGVHIGNFVEVKKSTINTGSKVNHLAYIGDAIIGKNVNVGAGTITCNYDGVNKWKTVIEDNVFIGSNSSLVAPVNIGEGATIGAGSTISKNAPANQLTLARAKQTTVPNWQRPKKET